MLEILKYNNFVFVSGFNFSLLSLCPFDQKAQSETHCPTPALVLPPPPSFQNPGNAAGFLITEIK